MSYTKKFYNNKLRIKGNTFSNFLNLQDSQFLEYTLKYNYALFPSTLESHLKFFKTDVPTRKNILLFSKKLTSLAGYTITGPPDYTEKTTDDHIQLPPKTILKLFTPAIYFLKTINMKILSNILVLVLCRQNSEFRQFFVGSKYLYKIIRIHPYLFTDYGIRGLMWVGNSCYVDSVLVSLFSSGSGFVESNMLGKKLTLSSAKVLTCSQDSEKDLEIRIKIQKALNKLFTDMKDVEGSDYLYCTGFRKAIRSCGSRQTFYTNQMQDPVDFLEYLCDILEVKYNSSFNELPTVYNVISYPNFLAYHFDRLTHSKVPFTPAETVTHEGVTLYLSSVIIYTHLHYTCYFRRRQHWLYYDDMRSQMISYVGSYRDLLDDKRGSSGYNIQTDGVLYFYTEL
jgi:Ubiquitin carboxyl-terminal hydrolase